MLADRQTDRHACMLIAILRTISGGEIITEDSRSTGIYVASSLRCAALPRTTVYSPVCDWIAPDHDDADVCTGPD